MFVTKGSHDKQLGVVQVMACQQVIIYAKGDQAASHYLCQRGTTSLMHIDGLV